MIVVFEDWRNHERRGARDVGARNFHLASGGAGGEGGRGQGGGRGGAPSSNRARAQLSRAPAGRLSLSLLRTVNETSLHVTNFVLRTRFIAGRRAVSLKMSVMTTLYWSCDGAPCVIGAQKRPLRPSDGGSGGAVKNRGESGLRREIPRWRDACGWWNTG